MFYSVSIIIIFCGMCPSIIELLNCPLIYNKTAYIDVHFFFKGNIYQMNIITNIYTFYSLLLGRRFHCPTTKTCAIACGIKKKNEKEVSVT